MWEVKFAKTGEYQKTVNVFNLSGHNSGIYDLAFDKDTSHIATVSKDGTWKIFDTKSNSYCANVVTHSNGISIYFS